MKNHNLIILFFSTTIIVAEICFTGTIWSIFPWLIATVLTGINDDLRNADYKNQCANCTKNDSDDFWCSGV